jgi:hypothetical protein
MYGLMVKTLPNTGAKRTLLLIHVYVHRLTRIIFDMALLYVSNIVKGSMVWDTFNHIGPLNQREFFLQEITFVAIHQ